MPFEVAWEFRRWQDGRVLFSESFGAAGEERFGAPYLALHRADLLSVTTSVASARGSPSWLRTSTSGRYGDSSYGNR